jgi:hypothetical protein
MNELMMSIITKRMYASADAYPKLVRHEKRDSHGMPDAERVAGGWNE